MSAKDRFDNSLPRNYSLCRLGLPAVPNISPIVGHQRFYPRLTQEYCVLGYIPLGLPDARGTCCPVHPPSPYKNRSPYGRILKSPCGPRFLLWRSCCVGRAHVAARPSTFCVYPKICSSPFTNVMHFPHNTRSPLVSFTTAFHRQRCPHGDHPVERTCYLYFLTFLRKTYLLFVIIV